MRPIESRSFSFPLPTLNGGLLSVSGTYQTPTSLRIFALVPWLFAALFPKASRAISLSPPQRSLLLPPREPHVTSYFINLTFSQHLSLPNTFLFISLLLSFWPLTPAKIQKPRNQLTCGYDSSAWQKCILNGCIIWMGRSPFPLSGWPFPSCYNHTWTGQLQGSCSLQGASGRIEHKSTCGLATFLAPKAQQTAFY